MKPFTESMRYEYDLTPDSLVIDAGGYEGNFANEICRKYGCDVLILEPVNKFLDIIQKRFQGSGKIVILPVALCGTYSGIIDIHVQNDSTGAFAGSSEIEQCVSVSVERLFKAIIRDKIVDLMKLNIEGLEFEVLEQMLELGLHLRVKNIQVQFHTCAPNYEARWKAIREGLLKTHELTFDAPWCWENYRLK